MKDTLPEVPRGIRTNNPLMIRPSHDKNGKWTPWQGELTPVDNYCVFIDAPHGLRAGFDQLLLYQTKHGLRTVTAIITTWSPAKDNNNVQAYIKAICDPNKWTAGQILDLRLTPTLTGFGTSIIWHENGQQPYTAVQIATAVDHALKGT